MSLQQPGPGESFATNLALVAEVVCEDVHLQGGGGHIHLVADVAGLDVLLCELEVGLPVPGEVGAGGEVFAALVTPMLGHLWLGAALSAPVIVEQRVHGEGFDGEDWGGEGTGGEF